MTISGYFEELKTKDIFCWGQGKHFKNLAYPFLKKSGLIDNLRGFVDVHDGGDTEIDGRHFPCIGKKRLSGMDPENALILVAVTGYEEIMNQLGGDEAISRFEAVPAVFLEALYEDMCLLSVPKPPLNFRKHKKPVIPKMIHGIWFSGEPMPKLYLKCLESWKKYAPDMEIKIWNLENYKPDKCRFFEEAIDQKNWAFASDYARADILRRYGGVYMDLDVEMLRPIDDLLCNDAYMSFESADRIECGSGMGAKPGNPIIEEICESYEKRPYFKADGSWDNSTCPVRYTRVIEKHGLKKDGSFQFVEDITVYPFEVLTGKSFDTGIIYRSDLSYTVHHHNGSWIPGSARSAMQNRYEKIREFLEPLVDLGDGVCGLF